MLLTVHLGDRWEQKKPKTLLTVHLKDRWEQKKPKTLLTVHLKDRWEHVRLETKSCGEGPHEIGEGLA